jgi:hypothetical protein
MELKFTISKDSESLDAFADFDKNNENFYYVQEDVVTEDPNVLNISEEFKLELGVWDVAQWCCDSIPYGLTTRTGIKFEFDYLYFQNAVQSENLWREWRTLLNTYGDGTELLEKGLITPKLILKEYNKLMEEYE